MSTYFCRECSGTGTVLVDIAQAGDQTLQEEWPCPSCSNTDPESESEIDKCERETSHSLVKGTNFCRCTHVMYDDGEPTTYEDMISSGYIGELLPPTSQQIIEYLEDEVGRLREENRELREVLANKSSDTILGEYSPCLHPVSVAPRSIRNLSSLNLNQVLMEDGRNSVPLPFAILEKDWSIFQGQLKDK